MDRPTLTVRNHKFGQPDEPPRVVIQAEMLSDLIAELQALKDEHGDLPVAYRDDENDLNAVWQGRPGGVSFDTATWDEPWSLDRGIKVLEIRFTS